jgi:hypothetical protein
VAGNGEGSRKSSSSSGERGPGNFHVFFWLAWGVLLVCDSQIAP